MLSIFRGAKVDFKVGAPNRANDPNTIAVRKAIRDEFHNGEKGLPLQCSEYVQWRVLKKLGVHIAWPVASGRNGGRWWKIFQDAGLYKVSNEPKRNAAMCFTQNVSIDPAAEALGHVAFVERVHHDGSIDISETNWPQSGIYNERTLTRLEWEGKYAARFVEFR